MAPTMFLTRAQVAALAKLHHATLQGAARKNDAPILAQVLLSVEGGVLTAYATDRMIAARLSFDVNASTDQGKLHAVVPSDLLVKLARHKCNVSLSVSRSEEDAAAQLRFVIAKAGEERIEVEEYRHPTSYPAIGRLFPSSVTDVERDGAQLPAGVMMSFERLGRVAKLTTPRLEGLSAKDRALEAGQFRFAGVPGTSNILAQPRYADEDARKGEALDVLLITSTRY